MIGPRATALAILTLVGCGAGPIGSSPDAGASTPPDLVPPPSDATFTLTGTGEGASEAEACQRANRELAAALLGDARWLDVAGVAVHEPQQDSKRVTNADEGCRCEFALDASRAAAVLAAFEYAPPTVRGPEAWHDVLHAYLLAHIADQACARRAALFGVTCSPADTAQADRALEGLAAGLSLAPTLEGGAPLDREGRLLRAPAVVARWHGVPTAGVPVAVGDPAASTSARSLSDARGRIELAERGKAWRGPVQVAVDAEALLGPLAHVWPPDEVRIEARPVDAARWCAVGNGSADIDPFVSELARALANRGLTAPASISDAMRTKLTAKDAVKALPALADAMAGRVDVLLRVSVSTRFAGRASGSRVWHEAIGVVEAYDVWTGRAIARIESSAKAQGETDARAAAEARKRLAPALADVVASDARIPKSTSRLVSTDL